MTDDPFDLRRFEAAQDADRTYGRALAELRAGRKATHWMWFVFPQLAGLGRSAMSERYGISSLAEARAYLDHPVLGARLRKCARVLTELPGRPSAADVLGPADAMKLRSSMTLFAAVADGVFTEVLDRLFDGGADPATQARLASPGPPADGD